MAKSVEAWHFIRGDYTLRDGRKVTAGSVTTFKGRPKLCVRGLHASERLIDALRYAPGPILCRVVVSGKIVHDKDKLVGTRRRILWTLDATHVLHEFACKVAEDALTSAGVTDKRSWGAIKAKRRWLAGEATDSELAVAWDAARGACESAWVAWAAAAARDAGAAARDIGAAARAAQCARDAARVAARVAARDAARDARDAQNTLLEEMIAAVEFE